eukprot:TRINITY_DN34271_c0_g1_i1.p1 TRINITY_DN34271_c0_g1~~TRINITY_DN34271_c0_g1_i1.p1  ORF type:complete len:115 (+),score=18.67 TRINITY_DN34271_c0_g1_i1:41-385(+)
MRSIWVSGFMLFFFFFFQAEDGIRDAQESRGLGDVYKRQDNVIVVTNDVKCCRGAYSSRYSAGLLTCDQLAVDNVILQCLLDKYGAHLACVNTHHCGLAPVSYTHLTLPTKRIV